MNIFQMKELHMLKEKWLNLSQRDQRAAILGSGCLILFLIYALIWSPIRGAVSDDRQALTDQTQLLVFVREAEAKLTNVDTVLLRKEKVKSPLELLSFLKTKIDDFSLTSALINIKQAGDEGVALTFKNVKFDECLRFLISILNVKKVEIQNFSASALSEAGRVNVDVVIVI